MDEKTGQFSGEPFAGGRILNAEPYSGLSKGYEYITPNLTPDKETGIGNISDAELARSLRYMVSHKNKFMAPFMAFQGLSNEDLTAIISFLRSQEPVKHKVEPSEYRFLGKALLAFGALKPEAICYLTAAENIGKSPKSCLFIDDREINIAGALNVGMQALLFKGVKNLREELKSMSIL